MPRKGRDFEKLVAELEKTLGNHGVEVKSPEYIRGKSGVLHEIDVSIRGKLQNNSIDYLIILQCRERKNKEGVVWIEEIASKKEDIGANQAIAVSSKGFTKHAKKYADEHGILLRVLGELDSKKITDILSKYSSNHKAQRWGIISVALEEVPDDNFKLLPPEELSEIYNKMLNDTNYCVFRQTKDGKLLSLSDLMNEACKELPDDLWTPDERESKDVSSDDTIIKCDLIFKGIDKKNWFEINTSLGYFYVQVMKFEMAFWREDLDIKPKLAYFYVDGKKNLLLGTFVFNSTSEDHNGKINCTIDFNNNKAYVNGVEIKNDI